jgi:hypothetical protein
MQQYTLASGSRLAIAASGSPPGTGVDGLKSAMLSACSQIIDQDRNEAQ